MDSEYRPKEKTILALTEIARELLTSEIWTDRFCDALSRLGQTIEVSRVYISKLSVLPNGQIFSAVKYSWTTPSMSSSKEHFLLSTNCLSSGLKRWTDVLGSGNVILSKLKDLPTSEQTFLAPYGVLSFLIFPIFTKNQWWGIIGFDDCVGEQEWPEIILDLLRIVSTIIGSALGRIYNEKALREANELFQTFIDFAYDWEEWILPDGSYRYVSPACKRITGYASEDFIKKPSLFLDIVYPEDRQILGRHLTSHLHSRSEPGVIDFRIISRSGEQRWINHQCQSVFMPDGIWAGSRASNRDITKRKESEEEQKRLQLKLLHSQKLESLELLSGGIAHDFNNLLMGILGSSELAMRKTSSSSVIRPFLVTIESAARQAAGLTNQLLAYSGKGRFIIKLLDLSKVIEEMIGLLEVSISKKASLKIELSNSLPSIEADVSQVQQIVLNLVINASEAVEKEKYRDVHISTGSLLIDHNMLNANCLDTQPSEGVYVYIRVSDTGCGMDTETISHILDPFYSTKFTGRGLGLSAIQGILRGHKGVLFIDSALGQGTTFTALFPSSSKKVEHAEQNWNQINTSDWNRQGKILLIDDEEIVRITTKQLLESLGYEVILAQDGSNGVEIFRELKYEIACILLDLTMPKMCGKEALDKLLDIRSDVPIILSSGYNEQDITQQFAGKGLAGFIQKPYRLSALREVLEGVLHFT